MQNAAAIIDDGAEDPTCSGAYAGMQAKHSETRRVAQRRRALRIIKVLPR
jgi:hypothetical protein